MRADLDCAEFVFRALMPDPSITARLVRESALKRAEDFRTLAEIVLLHPEMAIHHATWRDALEYTERQLLHHKVTVCSSPLYRRWLHQTGRGLIEGLDLGAMQNLLASVGNYVQGFDDNAGDWQLPLAMHRGRIETWDCAVSVSTGSDRDGRWYGRLNLNGVELGSDRFSDPLHVTTIDKPQAYLPMSGIVIRNDLPGLRVLAEESRLRGSPGVTSSDEAATRGTSYPEGRHQVITEAASALMHAWPDEYADWRSTMRVVVPRLPPPGWRIEGFTLSSMQGAAWINPSGMLSAFESLVHEHSHVKLRYLEELVPLVQPGQEHVRFRVGWRDDPRLLSGILQGTYVHLHCILALMRYLENGIPGQLRRFAIMRLGELKSHATEGAALLRNHARFTASGHGFMRWADESLATAARRIY